MNKFVVLLLALFLFAVFTPEAHAQRAVSSSLREKPLVDLDLGAAAGTYNGYSYSEINLGVNLNMTDWFTWRNAGFKRFSSYSDQDFAGLDSTFRLIASNYFDDGAVGAFIGSGYRFASPSTKNAAIAEAGVGFNIRGFGLGLGGKYLYYDKVQISPSGLETKRDDIIYFVTLAFGNRLSF